MKIAGLACPITAALVASLIGCGGLPDGRPLASGTEAPPTSVRFVPPSRPASPKAPRENWRFLEAQVFIGDPAEPIFRASPAVVAIADSRPGALLIGAFGDHPTVWSSEDLLTWRREVLPDGRVGTHAGSATVGGDVALVAAAQPVARASQPLLWRRVDGGPWHPLPLAEQVFPAWSVIRSLTWGSGLFVAVGAVVRGDREVIDEASPAIWTSPDGTSWTRQASPVRESRAWLTTVTAGPGGFVAGGQRSTGDGLDAVLITSIDGVAWELVDSEALGGDQSESLERVSASSTRWLATVSVRRPKCELQDCARGPGRMLASRDARSWSVVEAGLAPPAPLGAIGEEFVAIEPGPEGYRVLTSIDGLTWTVGDPAWQPPAPEAPGLFGLAAGGIIGIGQAPRSLAAWFLRYSSP